MVTTPKQAKRGNPHGNPNIVKYSKETQFKPGQSGNPKGPPQNKVCLIQYVRKFCHMLCSDFDALEAKTSEMKMSELTAYKMVKRMVDGDWVVIKEILDREEGPIVNKGEFKYRADQPATLIINKITNPRDSKTDQGSNNDVADQPNRF